MITIDSKQSVAAGAVAENGTSASYVDPILLEKYDVRGPRYTSYPTADRFHEDFGERDLLGEMGENKYSIAPLSLYIHLPFCNTLCYYCGCNKVVTNVRQLVRKYLDYIRKEMALMRLQFNVYQRPVTQLHWGGGTPTFLDEAEMTELMHYTAKYFNLSNESQRDYSIEVDPRSLTLSKIDLLRGIGFNRISIGIQDFDPRVQKAVNRVQNLETIQEQVDYIRARSFRSLNFDLIYGLPHQSVSTIDATLDKVIALAPDRISCYNYAHLPDRFQPQQRINADDLPTPAEKIRIFSHIVARLTAANYLYIGMDHFVKPTDSLARAKAEGKLCRNFQGYSILKAADLVGIGISSISSFSHVYSQNHKDIQRYYACLDENRLPVAKGIALSDDDVVRRDVIQQLACYRQLSKKTIEETHKICFDSLFADALTMLNRYREDRIVELSADEVKISDKGTPFIRNICMLFDRYLAEPRTKTPTFSRII